MDYRISRSLLIFLVCFTFAATAKSLQLCQTLCDPTDSSPPGSPVPGILQARTLEWVAISFSNAWKWKVKMKSLSRVRLVVAPWTAAYQGPPSMGFSRQEYWSGVPLPFPFCIYRLYKRSLRAPTKENALVLIAVDIGGKNTKVEDQIRIWAAPLSRSRISTVLEGILGRWGGLWLPARERTLTTVTQQKHWLFLCFDLFCRLLDFFFNSSPPPTPCCSVDFIGTHYEI